jgi:hypothetical protein
MRCRVIRKSNGLYVCQARMFFFFWEEYEFNSSFDKDEMIALAKSMDGRFKPKREPVKVVWS